MQLETLAGLLISLGSLAIIAAALLPGSRATAERSLEMRLELIGDHPDAWKAAQYTFALGGALTIAGLAVFSSFLWAAYTQVVAWIALALIAVGAFFWLWQVLQRAADPGAYARGEQAAWLCPAFTGFTLAGLAAYGLAVLLAGYPVWLGLLLIGSAVILSLLYIVMKDLPPVLIYTSLLIAGVAIFL